MDPLTSTRRGRISRVFATWLALAALFVLIVPAPVLGQEADDGDLAFPATIAGLDVEVSTFTGNEWLDRFRSGDDADPAFVEGTEALLESVGAAIDDLTVKSGLVELVSAIDELTLEPGETEPPPSEHVAVTAIRIDGVNARDFVTGAVDLLLGDLAEPAYEMSPMAGRWALRVTDAANPGVYPRFVYLLDDTAWFVEGAEVDVWEALEQLPDEIHGAIPGAESLAPKVPLELGGRRRTVMYEVTEPFWLPTLYERAGAGIEDWLLDLYLVYGISPADMLGIAASWGVESIEESVQVEGYQVPGGPPEVVEQLMSEIILGDRTDLPEGVTMTDGQLGGRQVTTIDSAGVKQHVFASGDTVWIVTDYADQAALAEEAVAALP